MSYYANVSADPEKRKIAYDKENGGGEGMREKLEEVSKMRE